MIIRKCVLYNVASWTLISARRAHKSVYYLSNNGIRTIPGTKTLIFIVQLQVFSKFLHLHSSFSRSEKLIFGRSAIIDGSGELITVSTNVMKFNSTSCLALQILNVWKAFCKLLFGLYIYVFHVLAYFILVSRRSKTCAQKAKEERLLRFRFLRYLPAVFLLEPFRQNSTALNKRLNSIQNVWDPSSRGLVEIPSRPAFF